jgi:hypothetical protein
MSFIENLYLKKQMQALMEENIKLKEILNLEEAKRYPNLKSSRLGAGFSKAHNVIRKMFMENPASIAMGTNLNPEDIMLAYDQGDFALIQALSRKDRKAMGTEGHASINSEFIDHVSNSPTNDVVQTLLQRAIQVAHARSSMPKDEYHSWKQQNPVYSRPTVPTETQQDELEEAMFLKKNPMIQDNMTLNDKLMSWTRTQRPLGGIELPSDEEEQKDTMGSMMGMLNYKQFKDPETGKDRFLKQK